VDQRASGQLSSDWRHDGPARGRDRRRDGGRSDLPDQELRRVTSVGRRSPTTERAWGTIGMLIGPIGVRLVPQLD